MSKYFTTPIFYANGKPHLGHLYSILLIDVYKRANILFNTEDIFLLTGMDEHGQKVMTTSQLRGLSPQEHVDEISNDFMLFFRQFNIEWNHWMRTTDDYHKQAVSVFWEKLCKNGYIYKGKYSGFYSVQEETYVEKNSNLDDKSLIWREEECYYFKLSAFEEKLKNCFEQNPNLICPEKRYNEAKGFLKQGLKDFPISRPIERLSWGVPVPGDESQIIYVWIDALVNYLSAVGYPSKRYKEFWPAVHVLGKDILKFHSIYWIAMLIGAEVQLPERLLVHGWWIDETAAKISKSAGNSSDFPALVKFYTVDGLRFFLMASVFFGEDAQYNEEIVKQVVHGFLANKYGNLFLRVLGLVEIFFENKMPTVESAISQEILDEVANLQQSAKRFSKAPELINEYINSFEKCVVCLNRYFQENQIWKITDEIRLASELYFLLDMFRRISLLIWPIMPEMSEKVLQFFDLDISLSSLDSELIYQYKHEVFSMFPKIINKDC